MYLLDTNILLERLPDQEHAEDVGKLLVQISSDKLFLTDFSLHSICLILARLGRSETVIDLVQDLFIEGQVGLLTVPPQQIEAVVGAMRQFHLDFDDAYQFIVAEKNNLILVSFDSDFSRTGRGRKTPAEVLELSR